MIPLFVLAALFFLIFLHPYVVYPLTLRLWPSRPVIKSPTASLPTASAVFSAYNEERSLPAKMDNLREIKAAVPDIELIAYCDLSSDRSLELLSSAEPGLLHVIAATERTGKATGMARMVAHAHGDICIFTDANVILKPDTVETLLSYFADPEIGGIAGSLHYINEDASTTAKVGGLYWRLEEWVKRLESRTGSTMGADGSIFATRRSLYPEVPAHLLDDMTVSMAVQLAGKRLVYVEDVIAYEKNATSSTDEFRRKRRIACRAYNTHRYLWPKIRATFSAGDIYKYVSHKLSRWFGLVWLSLAGVCLAAGLIVGGQSALLAILLLIGVGAILLGRAGVSPFVTGVEIMRSILATFVGVLDAQRGMTYQTWAPAKSRD